MIFRSKSKLSQLIPELFASRFRLDFEWFTSIREMLWVKAIKVKRSRLELDHFGLF